MLHLRRVFIARLTDGILSHTKGVAVLRTQKACYGLFVIETTHGERRLYVRVSHMGRPI